MKREKGVAPRTPRRVLRGGATPVLLGLALAGLAGATNAATASTSRALKTWPASIPTSPAYRAVWSGAPQCAAILRLMRGQRSTASLAHWRRPAELGIEIDAQIPGADVLRIARGPSQGGLLVNIHDSDRHTYDNTLGLLSADRRTQWPVVEGLVMKDAPNERAVGGLSTLRYPCRTCARGETIFQPDVRGAHVGTDVVTVGSNAYQLYASRPTRFASVWALREGTSDPKAANHPVCLFVRK